MKTAVVYARYSSTNQTEQSIEGQKHVCEDFAKRNDIIIVDYYIDRAMSGTNDDRDSFQKMLKDSNNKKWDYVLVYKLDRFARNKYESAITTKKRNCNVVNIDKEFIENIVKEFLNNQLIIKGNLDFIVNKVYEYYLKRASSKTSLNTIKTDLQRVNTSISNILLAIEKGIFTDTTKSRLEELEVQKKDLQEKLIIEESKEQYELTKESIEEYFNLALSETPAKMIELFVKCVKVYEDKIEIHISNPMNKFQAEQSKKLLYTETQTKTRTFKGGTTKTTTKYYDIYLVV